MDIVSFYKNTLYNRADNAESAGETDWSKATLFDWWNETDGLPKEQMLYSYYGYIRGDDSGIISVIRDGYPETPSVDNLPPVRYILPFPNSAIQRSAGAYKNYYGY